MNNQIDTVKDLLQREPLDPRFEEYGNFIQMFRGKYRISGNFFYYSNGFSFDSDELTPELLDELIYLITENQNSREYKRIKRRYFPELTGDSLYYELWRKRRILDIKPFEDDFYFIPGVGYKIPGNRVIWVLSKLGDTDELIWKVVRKSDIRIDHKSILKLW